MNETPDIRPVQLDDAARMAEIYRPFVLETAVSFETDAPSSAEFAERITRTTASHPWFVGTVDGLVAGYAYASSHRARAAYRFSVETSAYVDPAFHRRGIAQQLYQALFDELLAREFANAYAGITLPNAASMAFHLQCGFLPIGTFPSVGYKFERWHDVAWLHRPLEVGR